MKLSVIIPTRGRHHHLRDCLAGLDSGHQAFGRHDYEIIVTDDARGDQAVETTLSQQFPHVRWTSGPGRGPAANRNHGASLATGELLVFLDDDCLPQPGLLAAYAKAFATDSLIAAEGRISADQPSTRMDHVAPINEHGGFFWSCNIALRRDFFSEVGGFDERFPRPAMEDVELRERIRSMGVTIKFISEALVLHPYRITTAWISLQRSAEAHAIYITLPHCHLPSPSYRRACKDTLRIIIRRYIPKLIAFRGRGWWRATLYLFGPIWNVHQMKKALRRQSREGSFT